MHAPGHIRRWLFIAALAALSPGLAVRVHACDAALSGDRARATAHHVDNVIDGETLKLGDGAELRLLGIEAPKEILAQKEKAALSALTVGKTVQLLPAKAPRDRYGRLLAQVFLIDEPGAPTAWVQGRLVEQGLARVATRKESRVCVAELLALEATARAAQQGLWALSAYAIRSADTIPPYDIGTFQLVEGTVQDVATVGGRTYINFGPDWKTDFTVTIAARDRKLFAADALDPQVMRGRKIRVRGFIERLNGPMIAVTHPEEIEMLP